MNILLIMDPGIPVPPPLYGGHERLVAMFAEEYHRLGHTVTVLSGPDSSTPGTNHHFGLNKVNRGKFSRLKELFFAWWFLIRRGKKFDLVHNFGRLLYLLPVLNSSGVKIMTYGRPVNARGIRLFSRLPNKNLIYTACSNYCVSTGNVAGKWETVYNAIPFSNYRQVTQYDPSMPLMFLGRLDRIKGAHTAIKAALETNNSLWIAGNAPDPVYFNEQLAPLIDNEQIIYLGPLNDEQKNDYLGRSKALLFPIEWDEPFGMVMVEAMACGTPVIGFSRGSVPEVIDQGLTGFKVNTLGEMLDAIRSLEQIDRSICRETAFIRFDVSVIAREYLSIADSHRTA